MQALTVQIRIFPEQPDVLHQLGKEYIRVVNQLTEQADQLGAFPKVTTKDVETILPSAVCNQAIRDAKSVFRKIKKLGVRPILKKPVYFVNNQNYSNIRKYSCFSYRCRWKDKENGVSGYND